MKKLFLFAALIICACTVHAQFPGGVPGGNTRSANMGHVYGKLTDSTGKAISDVSVVLLQNRFDTASKKMKEILLRGVVTKGNGEFNFEELPVRGALKLKVTATGYKVFQQNVSFMPPKAGSMPSFDKDLGNIKLSQDARQLQEVVVSSSKPLMRLDGDKKIFNVEKNIVSTGGTALDVMKNVPSVQVDIDGNVLLRNSAPQLFVDGRPTTLTLDQIPADAIESVEVITNPSAKYDASGGGAGILNIVLKKNKRKGYNGSLRVGVDKYGAVNGGGDLSLRQDKFNFTASFNGNQIQHRNSGFTNRLNTSETPQTQINQLNQSNVNGGIMFSRVGLDYFVSNRTTLSLNGFMVNADFRPGDVNDIYTDSLFSNGKTLSYSQRISNNHRSFNGRGVSLGMKHLFPKEGEELTADANFFTGNFNGNSLYTTNYYNGDRSAINYTQLQKILSDGSDKNLMLQADYTKPFSSVTKLETGVRAAIRSRINNNYNYLFNHSSDSYVLVPSATSNYSNTDNVYAAYATVTSSIKNFTYKMGLRAESSDYAGTLTTTGKQYSNNYPVSLFPSVFLSQKLKNDQELQWSYSRRVNRPNFFQLIPFADSTDKLNITKGNPGLVPEFTQSFEMAYLKRFKGNNSLLASVYYKHTNNLITRYLDKQTDPATGNYALINTFINANSSYSTGLELTSINYLAKWWDINTNINFYNSRVNTNNIAGASQDAMWSWFGKFNSNFKLPSNFSVQLSGMYQSKTNLPINTNTGMMGPPNSQAQSASQGYNKSYYGIDIAIKKTFLKDNAAAVTLSVSDIFRTRIADQYSTSAYFVQDYSRLNDPQMIRLNFSYRFGKIDMSLFKRKSSGSMQAGSDSMQQ